MFDPCLGVFKDSGDLDESFLLQVYERIKQNEFKTGHDHCNHVLKVQQTLVAASSSKPVPNFCLTTYRRLVCFCRLYEIVDLNKKTTKAGQHQREVFLFNDMLLITKLAKSGTNPLGVGGGSGGNASGQSNGAGTTTQNLYTYRRSILLSGCHVSLFSTNYYPFGIRITAAGGANSNTNNNGNSSGSNSNTTSAKPLIMFNARNDIDRKKFYEDLRESIAEITEMEMIRISAGSGISFALSGASGPGSTSSCGSNGSNGRLVGSSAMSFSPSHSLQSKSSSLLDLTSCLGLFDELINLINYNFNLFFSARSQYLLFTVTDLLNLVCTESKAKSSKPVVSSVPAFGAWMLIFDIIN